MSPAATVRYRKPDTRIQLPPAFRLLCAEWVRLSRSDSEQWWKSLSKSNWSHAHELRGAILGMVVLTHGRDDLARWLEATWQPARLIAGLEDLVTEKLLERRQATRIEESILERCDAKGAWL